MEVQQKCGERGCPFPANGTDGLCGPHRAMFSETDSSGELFEEFQSQPGSGRRNGTDVGHPEVLAGIFSHDLSMDHGGVFSREVAADKKEYRRIVRNAVSMKKYRKYVLLRRCVECGKPLNSNEKAFECERCRKKSNRARRTVRKLRARAGLCVECGKRMESAVLPQRKTCESCRKGKNKKQRIRRRRQRGLPLSGVLYNTKEVASIVGVHPLTVARWVRTKRIQSPAWHGRGVRWTQGDLKALRRYKVKFYKKLRRKGFSRRTIRARARKSGRIRARLRRSLGQCVQCGAKVEISGRWFCLKCRTNLNASRRARREAKFRNSRICPQCEKRPAVEGKSSCADCLQKAKERTTLRYRQRKRAGLCVDCGGQRDTRGMLKCSACSENSNKRRKQRRTGFARQRVPAA